MCGGRMCGRTPDVRVTSSPDFEKLNKDDYDEFGGEEAEDWPPFRKVGLYDPYSDDPRLGVRRLDMCAKTGTVLIGGTAGQSIIFILSETAGDHLVPTKSIDLLEKQDDKVKWKGMD